MRDARLRNDTGALGSTHGMEEPKTTNHPVSEPTPNSAKPPARVQPHKPRKRWPWIIAGLIIVLGIIGFSLFRRHSKGPTAHEGRGRSAQGPLMVSTITATNGDIGVYVNALGSVTPLNTVAVRSRADGQLIKVAYTEGQIVKEGDSLAEIDPRAYQAQLTQVEGQFARDSALLENARLDLERYQAAFKRNAVPKQTLDTQMATVHQYEGTVRLDQGMIDNAKVQLSYCHITSPLSGRVGLRLVDPGNIVHASDTNPLAIITQLQPIAVIFSVAEDYLPSIEQRLLQGQKLAAEAFDRTQQKKLETGTLETLDNQIDPTTGTLRLKALFANTNNFFFPNQFVNIRLLVDTHRNVTLLPNPVLQRNAQGAFVYLVKPDQTVGLHPITVGTTDGNVSEVEGLEAGAVVAADNFNRLTDGAKITIRGTGNESRTNRSGAMPDKGPYRTRSTNGPVTNDQ